MDREYGVTRLLDPEGKQRFLVIVRHRPSRHIYILSALCSKGQTGNWLGVCFLFPNKARGGCWVGGLLAVPAKYGLGWVWRVLTRRLACYLILPRFGPRINIIIFYYIWLKQLILHATHQIDSSWVILFHPMLWLAVIWRIKNTSRLVVECSISKLNNPDSEDQRPLL